MLVYWLEQEQKDLPNDDAWLCSDENERFEKLRFQKRRADWKLGRWTAKCAVAFRFGWPSQSPVLREIEIRATESGAPQAFAPGLQKPVTISISHSSGRAICAISASDIELGCDLEWIEPRSQAFIADYFTRDEQARIERACDVERSKLVTLLWSAKESALKAMHEGLRLDPRCLHVSLCQGSPDVSGWSPLQVHFLDRHIFPGCWSGDDSLVRTVVADPFSGYPVRLPRADARSGYGDAGTSAPAAKRGACSSDPQFPYVAA